MAQIHLTDICGYEFFQISLAVVICMLPYMFLKYTLCSVILYGTVTGFVWLWNHYYTRFIDVKGRSVFITGCDSGLGHGYAVHLDDMGFTVFAGCLDEKGPGARKLKHRCSKRLQIVEIDITKDKSVTKAFEYVKKNTPRNGLWGIVNNAGANMIGNMEFCTPVIYHKGVNLNLYGTIRVIKQFLPLLRKSQGRIVNVTSVMALIGTPHWSMYEVTKHGLETMSDSLRMEMKKFGISVSIVEPGDYSGHTAIHNEVMVKRHKANIDEMWDSASPETRKVYSKRQMESWISPPCPPIKGANTEAVSKAVEHALCSERPNTRYTVPGYGSKFESVDEFYILAIVYKQLPTWIVDAVLRAWLLGKKA